MTIPLHGRVAAALATVDAGGEYVFPHIHEQVRRRRVSEFGIVLKKLGLKKDGAYMTFHCWRHTFRTRLAAAGVSKEIAQKLGGWTTDVSEIYNHDFDGMKRAIDGLE